MTGGRRMILSLVLVAGLPSLAAARDGLEGVKSCRGILDAAERLACFDREAVKLEPPRFAGRLGVTTDRFSIERPTRLRFQSDGAIFVLYLKDDHDRVVQNLHIGGGGEDSYVIEHAGTYYLQINGSESWRIWLEPHPTTTRN
ncbi:MAG: hypothetical protein ABL908_00815 [Hyphomicrobium sp.]